MAISVASANPMLCPHLAAQAKAPQTPIAQAPASPQETFQASAPPDLPPDHSWLAKDDVHTPVPTVTPEAWKNAKHYAVAIAGGGMGGMYTAWRLEGLDGSAPVTKDVAIFERTKHLGGRVHTAPVPGAAVPFDVGAMRFIPSQHHLLNGIAEHFEIPTRDFVVAGDNNLQFFRGKRLTNKQLEENPGAMPYNLAPQEQGKTPDELLAKAIEAVIPNFSKLTPAELIQAMRDTKVDAKDPVSGTEVKVPLEQLGLRNILSRTLSKEAVAMITDCEGYESDLQNWDAGQAVQELAADYRPGVAYKVPTAGMGAFSQALEGDLTKNGTEINRGETLRRVDYDQESKQFHLTFQDHKGNAVPVVADQVVLNLPKVPLKAVVEDSPFLQGTALEQTLGKVTANPLTRIFATFEKPWWNEMGIEGGRSMSDLNLGQVYYYGKQGDQLPYVEIYNDGSKSQFWEGLQNPGNPGVTTSLDAKPQLAQEIKHELEEMHGRDIPNPTGITYKRWADPMMGAGWHTWNPGSKPLDTAETMVKPLKDLPLFVTGEAFSTAQGWIEGALQTSEKVLGHMGKAPAAV